MRGAHSNSRPTHFVAVEVTGLVREELIKVQDVLEEAIGEEGMYRIVPGKMHITLALLRLPSDHLIATAITSLSSSLSCHPAVLAHVVGVHSFGGHPPKVVWAAISPNKSLSLLRAAVLNALRGPLLVPDDDRPWTPHITLFKGGQAGPTMARSMLPFAETPFGTVLFDRVHLLKMGGRDPHYHPVAGSPVQLASLVPSPDDEALRLCYQVEVASFPPDEAASLPGMTMRRDVAGSLFCWLRHSETGQVLGFCNATATCQNELTHDSMSHHEPDGRLICIHSVTVPPALRRKGIGLRMLLAYLDHVKALNCYSGAALICKADLISFYEQAGFVCRGESKVVHGKDTWYDCEMRF